MLFLTMSNADISFQGRSFLWSSYISEEIFLTIRQVELIGKRKFAESALNLEHETFVVHGATLTRKDPDNVQLSKKA